MSLKWVSIVSDYLTLYLAFLLLTLALYTLVKNRRFLIALLVFLKENFYREKITFSEILSGFSNSEESWHTASISPKKITIANARCNIRKLKPNKSKSHENFYDYFQIGNLLNLTDMQARLFACIALGFSRKDSIATAESSSMSIDGVKRDIARKLGLSQFKGKTRDAKIREIAQAYIEFDYTHVLKLNNKSIDANERIHLAMHEREKQRIYETVVNNPEILEMINQIINEIET